MWCDVLTRRVWMMLAAVAVTVVYVCVLYISDEYSVVNSPGEYNITDELGHVIATFPSANYMKTFLGTWSFANNASSHSWVRFIDDTSKIKEGHRGASDASDSPEPCPPHKDTNHTSGDGGDRRGVRRGSSESNSSDYFCVIWRSRDEPVTREVLGTHSPVFVFPSLALNRVQPILIWRLIFQSTMSLQIRSNNIILRGSQANMSTGEESAAMLPSRPMKMAGTGYWYAFGFTEGDSHELRSLFGVNDTYALDLVDQYIKKSLDGADSIRLFARVYNEQQQRRRQRNTTNSSGVRSKAHSTLPFTQPVEHDKNRTTAIGTKSDDDYNRSHDSYSNDDAIPKELSWDVTCFWLSAVRIDSSDAISAHALSTCGDELELQASAPAMRVFLSRVNLISLLGIVTSVLPMLYGTFTQFSYIHNSRAHTLWVSMAQLYAILFWIALDLSVLTWFMSRSTQTLHALSLLFYLGLLTLMMVGMLISSIHAEVMRFEEVQQRVASRFKWMLYAGVLYWTGSVAIEVLGNLIVNSVLVQFASLLFFVPQIYHNFRLGNWTGLTVPFLCGCATLILAPFTVTAMMLIPPWTISRTESRGLVCAALLLTMETFLLVLFRVTKGRHLLPLWMAPWRYVYQTTVEKQRDLIAVNPGCPICCSTLIENWSENDQLWITPCHHLFHKSCLERWMLERMECPLCRTLLPDP